MKNKEALDLASTDGCIPIISVAIVCYNTPFGEISRALISLIAATSALKKKEKYGHNRLLTEITLINNNDAYQINLSEYAELDRLLQLAGGKLLLLEGHGNIGFGAAQNLVLTNSKSQFHLIMNSDVVVSENTFINGISYLRQNLDIAAVSPAAVDRHGVKQHLCKQYPTILAFLLRGFAPDLMKRVFDGRLSQYEMRSLSEDRPTAGIPIISGCFIFSRTACLQKVGGFDDAYFLYFEDFDLSMRLNQEYSLAYLPSIRIIHEGGNAARKGILHIYMFARSAIRFFSTYGWNWF